MTLVDTSIWIDHLRDNDSRLAALLEAEEVLSHPFVVGELALGSPRQRESAAVLLDGLPHAAVATDAEVFELIAANKLFGRGIGYVDCHLLAAARMEPETVFWTRDRRLHAAAIDLGVASPLGATH